MIGTQAASNIAAWNDQGLDLWHDIVVSFEYARYNLKQAPTGGFAVVFFDSIFNMPREGGPGYCLGYSPTAAVDRCRFTGYKGLEGAIVGVGFDSSGVFALSSENVDGITTPIANSFSVRGGILNNYNLLYASNNLRTTTKNLDFLVDKQLVDESQIVYNAVRISLVKGGTELNVELKDNENNNDFVLVKTIKLPERSRTSVKVAVTNTTLDAETQFKLQNFNVAGYPGEVGFNIINTCTQNIVQEKNMLETSKLGMGTEFITSAIDNRLYTYTTNTTKYELENINYSTIKQKILGSDSTRLIVAKLGTSNIDIYEYLGERLAKTASINLPLGVEAQSADIDNKTLVICGNNSRAYIYNFISVNDTTQYSEIGTWKLYQTIAANNLASSLLTPPTSAWNNSNFGISTQIDGNNLLIGGDEIVHAFRKESNLIWTYIQPIYTPFDGNNAFGSEIALDGRDAIIGAPNMKDYEKGWPGSGEAYHYFLSFDDNRWVNIVGLNQLFKFFTLGGNFGKSIQLKDNLCVVGSPGEMYNIDPGAMVENKPNVGRIYIFQKNNDGYFSSLTTIQPSSALAEPYMMFGNSVNINKNYIAVGSTYTENYNKKSYITVFNINCIYETPLLHLNPPDNYYGISDQSGFIISYTNTTYLTSLVPTQPPVISIQTSLDSTIPELTGLMGSIIQLYGLDANVYNPEGTWYWNITGGTEPYYVGRLQTLYFAQSGVYPINLSAYNAAGFGEATVTIRLSSSLIPW